MKFDVDDKNRCRLACVKFHLNRCRFAAAVAKCLGAHFFGTRCIYPYWKCWCFSVQRGGGICHLSEIADVAAPADMRLLRAPFSRENVRRDDYTGGAQRLPAGGTRSSASFAN